MVVVTSGSGGDCRRSRRSSSKGGHTLSVHIARYAIYRNKNCSCVNSNFAMSDAC